MMRHHKFLITIFTLLGLSFGALMMESRVHFYSEGEAQIWFVNSDQLQTEADLITSTAFLSDAATQLSVPADQLMEQIDVYWHDTSNILSVITGGATTEIATKTAHDLAQLYVEFREDMHSRAEQDRQLNVQKHMQELRADMIAKEMKLRAYQMRADMPVTIPVPMPDPAHSENAHQLRLSSMMAQRRYQNAKELLEKDGHLDGLPSSYLSHGYEAVRGALIEREAELDTLKMRYGPKHPERIALAHTVKVLRTKLGKESSAIVTQLEKQSQAHSSLITTETNAQEQEPVQEELSTEDQFAEVEQLELEALSAQTLYQEFVDAVQPVPSHLSQPDARAHVLISKEGNTFVSDDSHINKILNLLDQAAYLLVGALAGLLTGLGLSYLLERLRPVYSTSSDLEKAQSVPVYGAIPQLNLGKKDNLTEHLLKNANSPLAESLRSVRTQIRMRHKGLESPRVVCVASGQPNEGKTTFCAMLAAIAAQSGDRVLLIDADMRHPRVHKVYDLQNGTGLVDVLTERLEFDDAVNKQHKSGVHVLTTKAVPSHALALIDSPKMWQMIRSVRSDYDLVLIDTPSALSFSDGVMISNLSDLTLYLVGWRRTLKNLVTLGMKPFKDTESGPMATVLTRVKPTHHKKQYGYKIEEYQRDKA